MARKPTGKSIHQATKRELLTKLNEVVSDQYTEYGKAREILGKQLLKEVEWWYERAKWLAQHATMREMPQVHMVKTMLDKFAPDRKELTRADVGPRAAPVMISIGGGLRRGTVEARDAVSISAGDETISVEE